MCKYAAYVIAVVPVLPDYEDKVTCTQLYELIQRYRGKGGLLVLDARTQNDYIESHIDEKCVISVPQEIIVQGCVS